MGNLFHEFTASMVFVVFSMAFLRRCSEASFFGNHLDTGVIGAVGCFAADFEFA
jgi:hypothetical protein